MIITCEACTKRYVVDAKAVGDEGRLVRCASCGHSWQAEPVKESVVNLFPEDKDSPASNENKVTKAQRPSKWIFISIVLISLICFSIISREHIIEIYPASKTLYKQLGLSVTTPGVGLSLQQIQAIPINENGLKSLVVKGNISNPTNKVKYLPPLKVRTYGNCGDLSWWDKFILNFRGHKHANSRLCMVDSWKHSLPESRLFPGERVNFETKPHTTLKNVTDLTVSF